ncbi:FAD-dependent oxidoreductase [Endozoicomonas sp. 8E]|uniref:FAD-dependent oxidoreductase n=1 Tax=Endozoicomonas sp. 8E TaxID=3035692 RepID=UPI0029393F7A|nr:FAD-dependent oxidoreductase [Endozoicomonas sp. 8E]WOG26721.1 FAD-dependent oxidoreductase [Endozoicomonas sp. 8E]
MTNTIQPTVVLAGGGHAHALFLKRLQKKQTPPAHFILVSASRYTPYSGMLPGVISGQYTAEQSHIDLELLAHESKCTFLKATVSGVDTKANELIFLNGDRLQYDILSINTGSTQARVIDAKDSITIKPIRPFLSWLVQPLPEHIKQNESFILAIMGAGAAGVEVAMALHQRFKHLHSLEIHIVTAQGILKGYPPKVQKMAKEEIERKPIKIHTHFRVTGVKDKTLISDQNDHLPYDSLILATSAAPARWPSESSLATSPDGFIQVNLMLQSVSHDNVFACGDVAEFTHSRQAKSGVYAVRQAPTLFQNICNMLEKKTLKPYRPQSQFLSLLSCADGRAIASKGCFSTRGRLIWLWKDWIDQRFMAQFPVPATDSMEFNGSD